MRVVDVRLLRRFASAGPCAHCGHWCQRRHPHHLLTRGFGGGTRMDVAINLLSVCPTCHQEIHAGRILFCTLLALVAAREGRLQADVEDELKRLKWAHR